MQYEGTFRYDPSLVQASLHPTSEKPMTEEPALEPGHTYIRRSSKGKSLVQKKKDGRRDRTAELKLFTSILRPPPKTRHVGTFPEKTAEPQKLLPPPPGPALLQAAPASSYMFQIPQQGAQFVYPVQQYPVAGQPAEQLLTREQWERECKDKTKEKECNETKRSRKSSETSESSSSSSDQQLARHQCLHCGKDRSPSYHHRHPIKPGQIPRPSVCKRCARQETSSESESPKRPVRSRGRKTKQSKPKGNTDSFTIKISTATRAESVSSDADSVQPSYTEASSRNSSPDHSAIPIPVHNARQPTTMKEVRVEDTDDSYRPVDSRESSPRDRVESLRIARRHPGSVSTSRRSHGRRRSASLSTHRPDSRRIQYRTSSATQPTLTYRHGQGTLPGLSPRSSRPPVDYAPQASERELRQISPRESFQSHDTDTRRPSEPTLSPTTDPFRRLRINEREPSYEVMGRDTRSSDRVSYSSDEPYYQCDNTGPYAYTGYVYEDPTIAPHHRISSHDHYRSTYSIDDQSPITSRPLSSTGSMFLASASDDEDSVAYSPPERFTRFPRVRFNPLVDFQTSEKKSPSPPPTLSPPRGNRRGRRIQSPPPAAPWNPHGAGQRFGSDEETREVATKEHIHRERRGSDSSFTDYHKDRVRTYHAQSRERSHSTEPAHRRGVVSDGIDDAVDGYDCRAHASEEVWRVRRGGHFRRNGSVSSLESSRY